MGNEITYAKSGVDRDLRAKAKTSLKSLIKTHNFSLHGKVLQLPFGKIFPLNGRYLDLAIEGVGTKVLLAQLADKYDTIGIDGVAMVVNDVIRSGAKPLAIADNIHAQFSDPFLIEELMKGLVEGAFESQCIIAGGEIGDVVDIIKGLRKEKGFDMVVSCIGEVSKDKIILGSDIKPKDVVIGFRSSGIHSNGISLARKVLFKEWGGLYEPFDKVEGLDKEIIFEVLKPTRIYVKSLQAISKHHRIKGAVHITGDAYLKFKMFERFSKGVGFLFTNFNPQPIFKVIKKAAQRLGGISDEEMLKTFNMGWGFAIIVEREVSDNVLDILAHEGVEADVIGEVTSTKKIEVILDDKRLILS